MNFCADTWNARQSTGKIGSSDFSTCQCNWIFTPSESHDGLGRARNMNVCALRSDYMWYQHILIKLLDVPHFVRPHILFSIYSCRHLAQRGSLEIIVVYYELIKRKLSHTRWIQDKGNPEKSLVSWVQKPKERVHPWYKENVNTPYKKNKKKKLRTTTNKTFVPSKAYTFKVVPSEFRPYTENLSRILWSTK